MLSDGDAKLVEELHRAIASEESFANPFRRGTNGVATSETAETDWAVARLKLYSQLGALEEGAVRLASWSDYQMDGDRWSDSEPFVFADLSALAEFSSLVRELTTFDRSASTAKGFGFARFIYREAWRKRCVIFERGDEDNVVANEWDFLQLRIAAREVRGAPSVVCAEAPVTSRESFLVGVRQKVYQWALEREKVQPATPTTRFDKLVERFQNLHDFEAVVEKQFGGRDGFFERKKNEFARYVALALITLETSPSTAAVCYLPGRGFLERQSQSEECSGGVYLWLTSTQNLNWKAIQVFETMRTLRASVADWADILTRGLRIESSRSARAAVFARNFSHVVGSHVISNPDFREVLVGESIERFRSDLERRQREFDDDLESYLRRGLAEDPEKFWKEGRQTLGQVLEGLRTGGALTEASRTFHEYLQGRFDFIARAIDETKDRPEPVFFVADLLDGFLRQSAFLDTFVADLGLRLPDLWVVLRMENSRNEFRVRWKRQESQESADSGAWRHTWEPSPAPFDVLVGLPGGMVAAHAFYSLLENVIRNSLKYGKGRSIRANGALTPYELTITLKSDGEGNARAWRLRIEDNFSSMVPGDIEDLLKAEFVGSDGTPRRHGLGLLEMQACSMALYEAEGAADANRENLRSIEQDRLVYELKLSKPVLLALVSAQQVPAPSCARSEGIRVYESIAELANQGRGAHLAVISADLLKEGNATIAQKRQALPYRLLALAPNANPGEAPYSSELDRRLQICRNTELYDRAFKAGAQGDEKLILDCYAAWLRAWKCGQSPEDGSWHLWIGLERSEREVQDAWKNAISAYSEFCETEKSGTLVHVAVQAFQRGAPRSRPVLSKGHPSGRENFDEDSYWNGKGEAPGELKAERAKKRCLVFDNHGQCFRGVWSAEKSTDYRESTRFYQKLTGVETPDLFRLLSHPPSAPFAFAFFIYGLVEACLADVAVLDERLAADLLFPSGRPEGVDERFPNHLGEHQKAGVFPVFSVRREKGPPAYFSPRHAEALRTLLGNAVAEEGLELSDKDAKLRLLIGGPEYRLEEFPCDALVIHEGALDLIGEHVQWPSELEKQPRNLEELQTLIGHLLRISPAVIRMSGRGRHTKHFPPDLPFIEFSEVSSALLTARNKFALVRGLFGAAGEDTST